MRWTRLLLEVGDDATELVFHPRLTVIAGIAPAERAALVAELLGALGGDRPGVRLELEGDQVAPVDGRSVIVGPSDLAVPPADRLARAVARVAAPELWRAAGRVVGAGDELVRAAAAHDDADSQIAAAVEQAHDRREVAGRRLARSRRLAAGLTAVTSAVAALAPAAGHVEALGALAAVPAAGAAVVAARRAVQRAAEAEGRALQAVGADTYLGFHLRRATAVNRPEPAVVGAAGDHHEALQAWWDQAGPLDPSRVWELRHTVTPALGEGGLSGLPDVLDALLGVEGLPLVLDDAVAGLPAPLLERVLAGLSEVSAVRQVVVLTQDPAVAAWARELAAAGAASLVEPAAAPPADEDVEADVLAFSVA